MNNYNEQWKKKISESVKKSNYFKNLESELQKKKDKYYNNPKKCLKCKKIMEYEKRYNKFCSHTCSGYANSPGRKLSQKTKDQISNSLKNNESFKINTRIANNIKNIKYGWKPKIEKICPICNKLFKGHKESKFCSRKCFVFDQQHGFHFTPKIKGGYRERSGRGKHGWYKDIWCNSTYELVWVIYNLDHNIQFKRNNQGFEYIYNNQKLKYYPDFITENNSYIEIKGFLRSNDIEKFKQFPHSLKILFGNDLKKEFDYVKEKYKIIHFEELYDNTPYNKKLNKCLICGQPAKFKFCSRKCSGLNASNFQKLKNINSKQNILINEKLNKCILCGKPAKIKFCSRKCCGIYIGSQKLQLKRKLVSQARLELAQSAITSLE